MISRLIERPGRHGLGRQHILSRQAKLVLIACLIVGGIVDVGLAFAFTTVGGKLTPPQLAAVCVLALPTLIAIAWILIRPGPRAVGMALGVGALELLAAGSIALLFFLGAWDPSGAQAAVSLNLFVLAANLLTPIAALTIARRTFGQRESGAVAYGVGVAVVTEVIITIAAAVVPTGMSIGSTFQWVHKNDQITAAIHKVQGCAFAYAQTRPDSGFPRSLDDIGPKGSRCVDDRWLTSARKLSLAYTPDPSGSEPVRSFRVGAHGSVEFGTDTLAGTGDTSGVIMPRQAEGAARSSGPSPEIDVRVLTQLRNCAWFSRYRGNGTPSTMEQVLKAGTPWELGGAYLGCPDSSSMPALRKPDWRFWDGRYHFSYRVEQAAGDTATHFVVEGRPVEYGRTGVNSYMVGDTGDVHMTHLDRPATRSDPVIPSCRYIDALVVLQTRCALLASAPADFGVALVHTETVHPDSSFELRARARGDTSHAPTPGLWAYLSCDATHERYNAMPAVSKRFSTSCRPGTNASVVEVVLYMRDTLGRVSWQVDTIDVRR